MEWLRFAAQRGRELRLLSVAAQRPGEGIPLTASARIVLGPLDQEATTAVVGPEHAAEALPALDTSKTEIARRQARRYESSADNFRGWILRNLGALSEADERNRRAEELLVTAKATAKSRVMPCSTWLTGVSRRGTESPHSPPCSGWTRSLTRNSAGSSSGGAVAGSPAARANRSGYRGGEGRSDHCPRVGQGHPAAGRAALRGVRPTARRPRPCGAG